MIECSVCKSMAGVNAVRFGICWRCIEAESIIESGLDMYDKSLLDNTPAKTAMDKVRLLMSRGCMRRQ